MAIFIPSPLGPMHASRSAPAWAKIRRHRAPGFVAAAWSAVLPQESLESRHLISSPLSRSSKSSALSHSAAWCSSLKKLQFVFYMAEASTYRVNQQCCPGENCPETHRRPTGDPPRRSPGGLQIFWLNHRQIQTKFSFFFSFWKFRQDLTVI